jgi:hypothetical protein
MFPFGQPVLLSKRVRSGVDGLGNDVFTTVDSVVVGAFNPGGSSEFTDGRATVVTQPTVYLPSGTDVSAIDFVTVGGVVFEVDATPLVWVNPFTGWAPGIEVRLKGVTG